MTAPREFLNETQERFLKGVLTKLPIEKIAELYLFQPIKQGGMESGVAVIASVPEAPPAPEPSGDAEASAPVEAESQGTADAGASAELEVLDDAGAGAELGVVEEPELVEGDVGAVADADADADVEAEADAGAGADAEADTDADAAPADDEELAELDAAIAGDDAEAVEHGEIRAPGEDVVAASGDEELEVLGEAGAGAELGVVEEAVEAVDADAAAEDGAAPDADFGAALACDLDDDDLADVEPEPIDADEEYPSQVAARYTVYSANYRLVLKGPDRGKWALDVKAEADAPLITLESVVRGVQHRSGDVEPPRRYDQAELRSLLRLPAPAPEAPAAP